MEIWVRMWSSQDGDSLNYCAAVRLLIMVTSKVRYHKLYFASALLLYIRPRYSIAQ